MSKKMLVNATHHEESRVAIVEEGILTELDIEVAGRDHAKGNIYKAVVVRVEPGLQAAFVDYGAERLGFLQIDEINYTAVKPDYKPADDARRPRINDLLQRGQELLVQITKEERGTKGAALTTFLSLAGRYMVLMPGSQTRGVSRKAESDSQRKELKKAMNTLDMADGVGYIVRTAALDQTREELERDYRYLIRLYESIKALEQKSKAPALLYKESNLMIRSIRDYFTTDMDEVLIDDPQVYQEARDFFQMVIPDHLKLVKQHLERRPIFSRYQIEDQIETLSRNKVALPSGGSIVIDPTEALVAIDVNSGKMSSEQGVEATATKTNLEAAEEVGRQLRLRDLGGLIVIDFIDMRERKNMRQVENQLKKSLQNDKARVSVGRISQFGLLEMSRQRLKPTLTEGTYLPCPHCNGAGHLKSPETQAVALLRRIHASAAKGQVSRVDAELPLDVAEYLLNNKREELVAMERDHRLQIHIHGNRDFLADQAEIEITKKEKDKAAQPEYVSAASLPMPVEETVKNEDGEAAKQDHSEHAEGDAEPGKKRRRRRRRKPAGATSAEETQATEQSEADPQGDTTVAKDTTETKAETATEQTDAEPSTKKPQRRRRSHGKPKTTEAPAEATDESSATLSQAAEAQAAEHKEQAGSADPKGTEAKPNRRRSSRKPKPESEGPQAQVVADNLAQPQTGVKTQVADSPVEVKTGEELPANEEAPKPKRPRRTSRKTEKPAPVPEESHDSASPASPAETFAQEKPAPRRPARRPRKKHVDEPAKPAQGTGITEDTPALPAVTEPEEKPKRRESPRPKVNVEQTQDSAESPKNAEPAADEKKVARKAPARRTGRKPAAKKGESAAKDTSVETGSDKTLQQETDEKPKPKRGRPRKKPAEASPPGKET